MKKNIFFILILYIAATNLFATGYNFDLIKIHKRAFEKDQANPFEPKYYGSIDDHSFRIDTLFNSRGVIDSVVVTFSNGNDKCRYTWIYNFSGNYLRYKELVILIENGGYSQNMPRFAKTTFYKFNDGGFLRDDWPNKGVVWTRNSDKEPWSLSANIDKGTRFAKDSVDNKILSVCRGSILDSIAVSFGFEKGLFEILKKRDFNSYLEKDSIRYIRGLKKQISENKYASIEMDDCDVRMISVYEITSDGKKHYIRIYENRGRDSYLCDSVGCFNLNSNGEIVDGAKTRARRIKFYNSQIREFCDQDYITGLVKYSGLPDSLFYNSDSVYTYRAKGSNQRYLTRLVKNLGNGDFAEVIYNDISDNRCSPQFVNTFVWENGKKRILKSNGVDISAQEGFWGASYCYGMKCVEITNKNPYEYVKNDTSIPKSLNHKCPFEKKISSFEKKMHVQNVFSKKSKNRKTYVNDDQNENIEHIIKSSPKTKDGYILQYTYSFFEDCSISFVSMVKKDANTEEPVEDKSATLRNDGNNTLYYVCDEQGKKYDDKCTCFDKNGKFKKKAPNSLLCLDKEDVDAIRGGHLFY